MLSTFLILQMIILVGVPIVCGLWLNRRLGLSWILFLGGGLAFVLAWIISAFIPVPAEFGLLMVSISQMGILYLVYRYLLSTAKTERDALMVGLGQGGIEIVILVIFLIFPTFTQMQALRDAPDRELISLAAKRDGISEEEVEPSDVDELRESIDDYWNTPWYAPLVQTLPSLAALPIQMALAIIVLGAWTQNTLRPLAGAMALHFMAKTIPVYAGMIGGIVIWVGLSLIFGGIALWFLRRIWKTTLQPAKSLKATTRKEK